MVLHIVVTLLVVWTFLLVRLLAVLGIVDLIRLGTQVCARCRKRLWAKRPAPRIYSVANISKWAACAPEATPRSRVRENGCAVPHRRNAPPLATDARQTTRAENG